MLFAIAEGQQGYFTSKQAAGSAARRITSNLQIGCALNGAFIDWRGFRNRPRNNWSSTPFGRAIARACDSVTTPS